MGIEMIGIDHSLADIDRRTGFSMTKKQTAAFLQEVKALPGIGGCVVLGTCNRTEVWVSTREGYDGGLLSQLCDFCGADEKSSAPYFVHRKEKEAVWHLFCLAGGLKSRILGEDQILTQVGEALAFARQQYATDGVLETLFRHALTGAKKVKKDVPLSRRDTSLVHTAMEELKKEGHDFAKKQCLVIGNGAMGKLAAELLMAEGADVTMTVRQYRSGLVDIPKGCGRIDYGRRMELFGECFLVVSATASPNYTLTAQQVQTAKEKPAILLDLAVPRDIDPAVGELAEISLYDVDSFLKEATGEEQKRAISAAEALLSKQMDAFFDWYQGRDVLPLVQTVKKEMAADVAGRLSKQLLALPLGEEEKAALGEEIFKAAEKSANRLLFDLKEELAWDAFRDCLLGMGKVYGASGQAREEG